MVQQVRDIFVRGSRVIKITKASIGSTYNCARLPGNDEDNAPVIGLRQDNRHIPKFDVLAGHNQVYTFTRFNLNLWLRIYERLNFFGENACGVDDVPGVDGRFLVTKVITYVSTTYLPLLGDEGSHLTIV